MRNDEKKIFIDFHDKKEISNYKSSRIYRSLYSEQKKDDILSLKMGRDLLKKSLNFDKINRYNHTVSQSQIVNINTNSNIEDLQQITINSIFKNDFNKSNIKEVKNIINKPKFRKEFLGLSKELSKVTIPQLKETRLFSEANQQDVKSIFINNDKTTILKNSSQFQRKTLDKFYCPFCEHCNKISDETLESYIFSLNETQTIFTKLADHIVNSGLISKKNIDFFNPQSTFNHDQIESYLNYSYNIKNEDLLATSKKQITDIETIMNNLPKAITNNRLTYQIISYYLNSLLEEKIDINIIASDEILSKVKESYISKGIAFGEVNSKLVFDKEIQENFDEKTIKTLNNLYHSIFFHKIRKISRYISEKR